MEYKGIEFEEINLMFVMDVEEEIYYLKESAEFYKVRELFKIKLKEGFTKAILLNTGKYMFFNNIFDIRLKEHYVYGKNTKEEINYNNLIKGEK